MGVNPGARLPGDWSGFRSFLQSDFQAALFWVKHAQMLLNLVLAASLVLLNDGLAWQQYVRVVVNVTAVGLFLAILVRE